MNKKCWECKDITKDLKWNSEQCDNCRLINNVEMVRTIYNGGLPPQL